MRDSHNILTYSISIIVNSPSNENLLPLVAVPLLLLLSVLSCFEGVFVGGGVVCTHRFLDGGGVRGGGERDIGAVSSELMFLQLARTHFFMGDVVQRCKKVEVICILYGKYAFF